jgi:CRISPR/Cas system-associated endoribonuclease Cas2
MKAILDAIYTAFTGNATLKASVNGRMYLAEAQPDAEFPYIVYDMVDDVRSRTLEKKYQTYRIQFSIFSQISSGAEAQNIFTYLDNVFGDDTLTMTITGYTFKRMDYDFGTILKEIGEEAGSKTIWHITADYLILVSYP